MPNSSPTPKTMFDTCIPKFSQVQTRVVSTLLKWGGEKELQGFFQKGAIFLGKPKNYRLLQVLHHWPKDFCPILWIYHWFWRVRKKCRNSILMPSKYPNLGSASDWLMQVSHTVWQIRSITQMDSEESSVWNICTHFLGAFSQGNQWWHREMSHVFSS